MSRRFQRRVVEALMLPIVLVGKSIGAAYKLLFGHADELLSKKRDREFADEIATALPFLFDQYGATILRDEGAKYPRPFDFVVALISTPEMTFRFTRGRGEFRVQLCPGTIQEWYEVEWVLEMVGAPGWEVPRQLFSVADASAALEPNMPAIKEAFSGPRFAETEQRLSDQKRHEHVVAKQLQNEINRRLYPDE